MSYRNNYVDSSTAEPGSLLFLSMQRVPEDIHRAVVLGLDETGVPKEYDESMDIDEERPSQRSHSSASSANTIPRDQQEWIYDNTYDGPTNSQEGDYFISLSGALTLFEDMQSRGEVPKQPNEQSLFQIVQEFAARDHTPREEFRKCNTHEIHLWSC